LDKLQIMTHLEIELSNLRTEVLNMWTLVRSQLVKARQAVSDNDRDLAHEILQTEKRINALELKIDKDCENIIALFNPVAVDLRFVLANLKINSNLERIADIAEGIAKYVKHYNKPFSKELLDISQLMSMFDHADDMMLMVRTAYENENTKMARTVFQLDEQIDDINKRSIEVLTSYIQQHTDETEPALYILSTIRKLERVGDQIKNLAEELIFYVDAKVLKHLKKKKLREDLES